MVQFKGHRAVGGMQASIYDAMPIEAVKRLVEYMNEVPGEAGVTLRVDRCAVHQLSRREESLEVPQKLPDLVENRIIDRHMEFLTLLKEIR